MKITNQKIRYRKDISVKEKDLEKFLKTIKLGDEIVANTRLGLLSGTVESKHLGWPVIKTKVGFAKYLYYFKSLITSFSKIEDKNNILRSNSNSKTICFNLDDVNIKIASEKRYLKFYQGRQLL